MEFLAITKSELIFVSKRAQIAKFMGPTWGPFGSYRPQMGSCGPHKPYYQGSLRVWLFINIRGISFIIWIMSFGQQKWCRIMGFHKKLRKKQFYLQYCVCWWPSAARCLDICMHSDGQVWNLRVNLLTYYCLEQSRVFSNKAITMMTSSNGNIFRVTGTLCGEFTGPGQFPSQRPVTRSFDVFFDLRLNKRLNKQPRGWWFETPLWSLWRQCNDCFM